MTSAGMSVLVVLFGVLAWLVGWVILLQGDKEQLQREYEEALAWSDKYQLDAAVARDQLASMRREYAVLNWLHEGTTAMEQSAAWLAGIKKGR
jgi:Tfp pilus assembly protein PilO